MTAELPGDGPLIDLTAGRLAFEEGFRADAYQDTGGRWTIGYGRCDAGVTEGMTCTPDEAQAWMRGKLESLIAALTAALPWWTGLDLTRRSVLLDMAYNIGVGEAPTIAVRGSGLLGFSNMLANVKAGNFGRAAGLMLMSRWADQVGDRAMRLSILMEHGGSQ